MDLSDKKYSAYSVEDLLQDDYFILSRINPTKESDAFWEEAILNGTIAMDDYKSACCFFDSVQVKQECISYEEIHLLWENIEVANKYNLEKKKRRFHHYLYAMTGVAASFILLFVWSNWLGKMPADKTMTLNIEDVKAPETPVMDIQLVLAENETISLEGEEVEITYKENGIAINNQEQELSKEQTDNDQAILYNQLIVPEGKRSMLTFADGSKIWVNARTRVVYPVVFEEKKREIYVDGEAFLEVFRNENCPFIVKTRELQVEVLGTSFNIMAYERDTVQSIVLVSGSVRVNSKNKKETILSPNEMYSSVNGVQEIKTVNVSDYISWRMGIYQYRSEYLGVILKRLSRYYGQKISCSPETSSLKCSGKLDLKSNLSLVLNGISKTAPIVWQYDEKEKQYRITNK